MRIFLFFNLTLMIVFITGCSSNKQTKEGLPFIDVRQNYPEKRVCLTEIAYVEFLYLCSDNNDFLFLGTISAITKNRIVVFDRSSGSILFFSRDGKPKSRFNRVGQGPEEHTHRFMMRQQTNYLLLTLVSVFLLFKSILP